MTLAVVAPVHGNADTLVELVARVRAAVADRPVVVHLVIDDCPASLAVARSLAAPGAVVVHQPSGRRGQHGALVEGLRAAVDADRWALLDADLQDPPEALPGLLVHLQESGAGVVYAGRRGRYERWDRLVTGWGFRAVVRLLGGPPLDAGACLVLDRRGRQAVLDGWDAGAPSVVVAAGVLLRERGVPVHSVPVRRAPREHGSSAWTSSARLRQARRSAAWLLRRRASR